MSNSYVLIMAGGAGTRLWPFSRKGQPKPLLPLVEPERSMFQISVERLYPLFPPERILVVASAELTPALQKQAPELPVENFIVEPMGRDTAPAVGLGTIHIRHRDPKAVIAVLTADHYIADTATFRKVLAAACQTAQEGLIVTLGIRPEFASTGFGYIERGALDRKVGDVEVYVLKRFTEKPDRETAERFVASGNYSWNGGMFIWTAERVMEELRQHAPALHADLERLAALIGQPGYETALEEVWPQVQRISVDYALMERVQDGVRVIPVEMGWSDIGSFGSLYDILSKEGGDNVVSGHEPVMIDTRGTLIYSKRLVATIGLEDIIIVDTDDALLVCRRDRVQDVKQLVDHLKNSGREKYL